MVKRTGLALALTLLLIGFTWMRLSAQDATPDAATLLSDRQVTVRPLETVTQTAAQILDITSDSARLHFVGTIPLACTVVFGTTTAFGDASVDLNMNGGAIVEHNPVMLHLQPDTDYYYRLQGSGEDGTLYIGEIGTFRTLPASSAPVANLLSPQRGAEVLGVSSNYGNQPNDGTWGILNAFDGNPNTAWASNGDGDNAWFEVRLGQRSHIKQIAFQSRSMNDGSSQVRSFTVTTDDGQTYGPFTLPDSAQTYTFDTDFEASTLRFDVVDSTGGNTGAIDVAVYGDPVAGN